MTPCENKSTLKGGYLYPIFLYGPPGSGKSALGRKLSQGLKMPLYELDALIEKEHSKSIPEIFASEGEAAFRRYENQTLELVLSKPPGVVALGGGALLNSFNRSLVEKAGQVVCLDSPFEVLLERLNADPHRRPLIAEDVVTQLKGLLATRAEHYASFPLQIDSSYLSPDVLAWEVQARLGMFHVQGMGRGYDVRVGVNILGSLVDVMISRGLKGPIALVTDENIQPLYAQRLVDLIGEYGFSAKVVAIPAGEAIKNMSTISHLWGRFLEFGLERSSTIIALGGGVVSDLAGFAAATYLRGIRWAVLPTSLLAMVDASLGGKTGADLPQGKNLVGSFHPPEFVLNDPGVLATLPEIEIKNGMAEVIKHGVIADPTLFELCQNGWDGWHQLVGRAVAVKARIIQEDPFEHGHRTTLNLGHTLGHAIEMVSGFKVRHGEAVAIGMVAAARASERMGIATNGLSKEIADVLQKFELPIHIPEGIGWEQLYSVMMVDKKKSGGKIKFVLPARIGETRWGIELEDLRLLAEV